MAEVETLTALIDFYGLKKEGKVVLNDTIPTMVVNKSKVEGVMPILSHLKSKSDKILGTSNLEKALVRQWIQFQFGCLDLSDKKDTDLQFRKLNENLSNKSFLGGENLTAADVLLFHGIHEVFSEMTFQDKDKFVHLSRWFRNVQQDPKLRRGKPVVAFSRSKLY
eukprot:GFUD01010826.1.p1 GENE.GFUD01010826.1~~GFUD01010826.1.p1  ORF type:complete len:165 (-),score=40.01 GFUD01010826.1:136-630(-)